jgi:hypothetical protein
MNRQQILERESRGARLAGLAALAVAPLYIVSLILDQSGAVPLGGIDTERYRVIDESSGELLLSAVLRAIAFALLTLPLLYLFRAAQARNPRVSAPMLGFVFIGPLLLAVQVIFVWFGQTQVASDFVAQATVGGDIYTLLDDLVEDSTVFTVAASLLFPAVLGLLVAMIYVPLQAMRAGLLTRFFATLGMALGAATLFILPAISLLALVLWVGWLGLIILDRTPRGRPPAWAAGEGIPWPKPGEAPRQPTDAAESDEVVEGDADEVLEPDAKDQSARRERARKRKRKRRQ